MSKADKIFKNILRDILENGSGTEGEVVRPHWPDGAPAYTIKRFGICSRYDLSEEFPAITLRPTPIKSCTDEMLWIWQRKSNDIRDLHSHVWDEWADDSHTIGTAYGYQQSLMYPYRGITEEGLKKAFPDGWFTGNVFCRNRKDGRTISRFKGKNFENMYAIKADDMVYMTQIDKALYDLVNTPFSRRIMVSMWNMQDLHSMNLEPCAYSMTFNVTQKPGHEKLTLNAILNQRSQDMITAGNWNVCQYAVLTHMLARSCGMEAGELVHVIADCHIYDRHIPIARELLERPEFEAPAFVLNEEKKWFYDFVRSDVQLLGYRTGEQVRDIPVAI